MGNPSSNFVTGWACPSCGTKGAQYAPSGRCVTCEAEAASFDARDPGDAGGIYQIGEVSERMGLSLRTVRYYEEAGLVFPRGRTPGGFRLYADDALERLALIKHMKPLGFTLEEMRDLLELRQRLAQGGLTDSEASQLRDRLSMYADAARQKYRALQEQMAVAESFVDRLTADVERYEADTQ